MLIVEFMFGKSKITWFINTNYFALVSFVLTVLIQLGYRRYKIRKLNKTVEVPNPTGGGMFIDFIDECVDPNSVYEVVDPALHVVLKNMMDLRARTGGTIIISVPVLILSYIISRQAVKQISIGGLNFLTKSYAPLIVKAFGGIISGTVFTSAVTAAGVKIGLSTAIARIFTAVILSNLAYEITTFDCNVITKVPMEQSSNQPPVAFLDTVSEKTVKFFVKESYEIEIYVPGPPSSKNDNSCSINYEQLIKPSKTSKPANRMQVAEITKPKLRAVRTCRSNYVPLKQRTKTLADIRKEDANNKRGEGEVFIQRYERRRENIMKMKNKDSDS